MAIHFTSGQIVLLLIGFSLLIPGLGGIGVSAIFTGIAFCIICVALCYRKWWANNLNISPT